MKTRHSTTAIIVLILLLAPSSLRAEEQDFNPPGTKLGARNIDGGSQAYGEVTETIPQEGSPDSGEPPSQEHPAVTASDPSMWDQQPHHECSKNNGNESPDYACRLLAPNRPTQPAEPAGGGTPRTITITTRQAATLIASGSGITRQPPGPQVWGAWCFSDWGSFSSRESIGWIPCQQRNTQKSSRRRLCAKSSRRNAR